jgi:hypothetical protein
MNTDTPRTDEWETYCDECYYHMWRVRRKNERGFDDGFHVQNGEGARQLVELLNKQDSELTAVTEQRDGLRSGIDYASDQLHKVTEQRDRLAEAMRQMWPFIEEDDYPNCNTPEFNAAILKYKEALQFLTTKDHE